MGTRERLNAYIPKLAVSGRLTPVVIVIAALVTVVALAVGLPKKSDDVSSVEPAPVPVEVEVLHASDDVPDQLVLHGVVEPDRTVMVAAEVDGKIEGYGQRKSDLTIAGVLYKAGQTVAEGEPIAAGDQIVVLNTDLLQAEHDRAKAQAEYDEREYARMQELLEQRVAAQQELDKAKTAMELSRAELTQASERLRRAFVGSARRSHAGGYYWRRA